MYLAYLRFKRQPLVRGTAALATLLAGAYVLGEVPEVLRKLRAPSTAAEMIVLAALIYPLVRALINLFEALITLSRAKVHMPMLFAVIWSLLAAIGPTVLFLAHKISSPLLLWLGWAVSVFTLQGTFMLLRIGFEDTGVAPLPVAPAAPDDSFSYADQQQCLAERQKRLAEKKANPLPEADYPELKRLREERREQEHIARMPMRYRMMLHM